VGCAAFVLVLVGFVVPSVRAGAFAVNVSAMTTVVVVAIVVGTLLGPGSRDEEEGKS
jgi:urea transporter